MKKRSSTKELTWRYLAYSLIALAIFLYASLSVLHINLAALLAAATSTLDSAPATLYFTPYGETHATVDDTVDIDINLNAHLPINALGVTVKYPKDIIELVAISKKKSFLDLWTEDTVIKEGSGELHFSGGTTKNGGMLGTSTVLSLSMKAKKAGDATLTIENLEVLAADGKGTVLDTDSRSITYAISAKPPAPPTATSPATSVPAPPQSADFNADGKVTLIDMSILIIKMMSLYDPRYDLNVDGAVNFSDLSVLFSRMGNAH
jgi:hypothetical protein